MFKKKKKKHQGGNHSLAKTTHIFSKSISVDAIFNDKSFNDMLTNDIVSLEQLGPGHLLFSHCASYISATTSENVLSVRPAKIQISLYTRTVLSVSSLGAF